MYSQIKLEMGLTDVQIIYSSYRSSSSLIFFRFEVTTLELTLARSLSKQVPWILNQHAKSYNQGYDNSRIYWNKCTSKDIL